MMKKVFITGAGGFIGLALVKRLLAYGIDVTVLLRQNSSMPKEVSEKIHIVRGNANDIGTLGIKGGYDVFYHLAWQGVNPEKRNDFDYQMKNVMMSAECVKAAASMNIPRFIILGSTMEYLYYGKPINSDAVPSTSNFYGAAKIAVHYACAELARQLGVGFIYAVATSVYGVGREDSNVIFYCMDKLLKGEKPSVTQLKQKWDYIHISDLSQALCAIGEKGKSGAFYTIGNGDNKPLSFYIETVRDIIDPALPLGIGEVPYSGGRVSSSCTDPEPLARDTGFRPSVRFEDGIAQVIAYYRKKTEGA